jgi:hypothetical protein
LVDVAVRTLVDVSVRTLVEIKVDSNNFIVGCPLVQHNYCHNYRPETAKCEAFAWHIKILPLVL